MRGLGDFFLVILYLVFYIGVPSAIVAIAWKPSLEKVQDYVIANEVGKAISSVDPSAEICVDKNWFSYDYYLKSNGKIFSIGNGYYGFIKVSNVQVKEITQLPELDKCNKLK